MLDLLEGGGKAPLGPCYVEARDGEAWRIREIEKKCLG
ncbi:hypothetical protein MES5069_950001 [Mesorhizobium escarrei]|uniref:Uncharacterized protein n=1 Tax=Mesorhizobium escarrei TaxID=666018 RepID=A0ABM9EJW6_9HYPH|nr:hypothetical protein MES5069_950001 [Mesorhizobium escarrei]